MNSKLLAAKTSIVVSEFNKPIIENLLQGALDAFEHHGGKVSGMQIYRVPGAFEIPSTVNQILKNFQPDAIITLGVIIKGGTPHFDYIATETSRALMKMIVQYDTPIGFGVLTTYTAEQALERSKDDASNKGYEATASAIEMASLLKQLKEEKK